VVRSGKFSLFWQRIVHSVLTSVQRTAIDGDSNVYRLSQKGVVAVESLGLSPDLLSSMSSDDPEMKQLKSWLDVSKDDATTKKLVQRLSDLGSPGPRQDAGGFHFDLPSAVHRQAGFAAKMTQFGWLYSPFLESTLQRAQGRYRDFFGILASEQGVKLIVPTLDIDLVWHTHQLSPTEYGEFSRAVTGRFVNHNDMAAEEQLRHGSKSTNAAYRERFGEEYRICLSWFCEAARLSPDRRLSPDEAVRLAAIIGREQQRGKNILDRAACQCHGSKGAGGGWVMFHSTGDDASCGDGSCGGCNGECGGCEAPADACLMSN